jgi:hypothetical protein
MQRRFYLQRKSAAVALRVLADWRLRRGRRVRSVSRGGTKQVHASAGFRHSGGGAANPFARRFEWGILAGIEPYARQFNGLK